MTKRGRKSILYLLIIVLAILAILVVPVSAAKLATPTIIMPPNNYHYCNINVLGILAWRPVPGAYQYYVEVQKKEGSVWVPATAYPVLITFVPGPVCSEGSYRYRVSANASNLANTSNPSAWRMFDYYDPRVKLATPTLVSPPSGTTFYHNNLRTIVLEWKLVPGADSYSVDIQYLDPATSSWRNQTGSPYSVSGVLNTALERDFVGPYKGQWRVTALNSANTFFSSNPSAWRTFTFKN